MRKSAKALLLVLVAFLGSIALTIGAAFSAALAFGVTALIVPGTGTPNANIVENYRQNVRDYYLQGTPCNDSTNCGDADLQGTNYPASFWPLAIFPSWCRSGPNGCDKWDDSVGQGVNGGDLGPGLKAQLDDALATPSTTPGTPDIIVFGYSQGGAVVSKTLDEYDWQPGEKERVEVVTIGGIENPDGGLWQRLAFLRYIPILDITFAPPMPVDPDLKTTTIGFEYDPVVYAPRYWGNPLAMINALAAFETVHGNYLEPNGNDTPGEPGSLPYGYTPPGYTGPNPNPLLDQLDCSQTGHPENCRYDEAGNAYIMIPATSLPMYDLLLSVVPEQLRPIVYPFVELATPVTKVLVDLGYDWSGDPGTPTPLSILPFNPFQNWLKVGADLAGASVEGVQRFIAALGGLGGATTLQQQTANENSIQAFSRLASVQLKDTTVEQKQGEPLPISGGDKTDVSILADKQEPAPVTADLPAADPVVPAGEEGGAVVAPDLHLVVDEDTADQASAGKDVAKTPAEKRAAARAAAKKDAADRFNKAVTNPIKKVVDKFTEAVDKARQRAADKAKDSAGNDKPAETDGTSTADAPAQDSEKAAA